MEFFGHTLTANGDIISPEKMIFNPDDKSIMDRLQRDIDKYKFVKIGQLHAIFHNSNPTIPLYTRIDRSQHPYWIVNLYNQQELASGYDSIKDLIANNFDKIWSKNVRQF